MTVAEICTVVLGILNFLAILFLPKIYNLFKTVHDLEIKTVELKSEINEAELKIDHIENNYKQGIEYVREIVDGIKADIVEMKTEMREILRSNKGQ